MCGIAGCYGFGSIALLQSMTDAIAHRGPDGQYHFQDRPVLLGNRRLAILDVEGGQQPVTNESSSVVAVYNGEIYNFRELREELIAKGHKITSNCDTEVIPHLYEEHGIAFAERLNGIFAIALWDRNEGNLYLIRDPLGVKPLLFAQNAGKVAFASEAKAILRSSLVTARLDEAALHLNMNMRYIPGERTLFEGIKRLPPGHFAVIGRSGMTVKPYTSIDWTPDESMGEDSWVEGIRSHLEQCINRQLISDVPIGVSLSGGIDSSALVAMIRRRHSGKLSTFTLGFDEPWDENDDARLVAKHFDTDHHDLVINEPLLAHLKDAVFYTEEPKVNCLQLFLLHKFMHAHVKVALSGLGGDELFAGYDIYRYLFLSERARRWIPRSLYSRLSGPMDRLANLCSRQGRPEWDLYVRELEWSAVALFDSCRQYLLLRNAWDFNDALPKRIYQPEYLNRLEQRTRDSYEPFFDGSPASDCALRAEFNTKMVNDLLNNEDTMSMANSVESRVPFLDLEFVRFASRMPAALRFKYGMKGMLRKALNGVLPQQVMDKKKWGFTVDPVEQFNKDLKPLALELLNSRDLAERGVFNPEFVSVVLHARPSPKLRWHYFMLWQMIGFEYWCQHFLDSTL